MYINRALFKVEGVPQLLQKLARFDRSVRDKYLAATVTATAKPHVPEVRAFTPKGPTGNLKRSVGMKTERYRRRKSASATAIFGYRSGGTTKGHLGYHAWWVDSGVKARVAKKSAALFIPGARARKVPYLKPLLDEGVEGTSKVGLWFRRVKGFAGSRRFRTWAHQNMGPLKQQLVRNLARSVEKAAAEQARRDNLRAQGRSTR